MEIGCRAIIFVEGNLIVIERNKNNKHYYTLPGGHLEQNETKENCVIREIKEEIGIEIEIIRKVYISVSEQQNNEQHYYLTKWIKGEFGTGEGPEYINPDPNNTYRPTTINIQNITNMNILPKEIINQIHLDLKENGLELRKEVLKIENKRC